MSLPLIELGQFIVNLSTTELMYVVRCADDEFKRRNGSINSILTIHQQQQQQPHVQTYASIVTSNLFPVASIVDEQKEKDKQQPDTEADQKNKNEEQRGEEEDCSSDPQKEEGEEQENIDHMTLYVKNEREHKDQKEFRKLLIDIMQHKKPIAHIWVDPKGRYSFVSFHETTKDDDKNKKIALKSKQLLEGAKINVAFAHQREKKEKK
jgi:hypothetical protein